MLKKFYLLLLFCGIIGGFAKISFAQVTLESVTIKDAQETELSRKLKSLEGVVSVQRIKNDIPMFSEKYAVDLIQYINPEKPELGTFTQQIYVCHVGYDRPTVMVTDGYIAGFGLMPRYNEELSLHYNANLVVIQHRYFGASTPNPTDWTYMKGKYAAADMHRINTLLRNIYTGKYIATGVSKGGQNTMIYNTYYPKDVDVWVPYVGPVCFGVEDGRHEGYLAKIGTKEERARILAFQREILKRRPAMVKMLDQYAKEKNLTFKGYDLNGILDLCVLEYPFALWQMSCEKVAKLQAPTAETTDKELFDNLCSINEPDYFANVGYSYSFYIQAAKELGYYGYSTKGLKDLLSIKSAKNYLKDVVLPQEFSTLEFDNQLHRDIYSNLKKNDPKMILIYGEYDPWSAVAPDSKLFKGKKNMKLYMCPKYDHKTRIRHFPEQTKAEIWSILDKWLAE